MSLTGKDWAIMAAVGTLALVSSGVGRRKKRSEDGGTGTYLMSLRITIPP